MALHLLTGAGAAQAWLLGNGTCFPFNTRPESDSTGRT
jgi:hypothetical protein